MGRHFLALKLAALYFAVKLIKLSSILRDTEYLMEKSLFFSAFNFILFVSLFSKPRAGEECEVEKDGQFMSKKSNTVFLHLFDNFAL